MRIKIPRQKTSDLDTSGALDYVRHLGIPITPSRIQHSVKIGDHKRSEILDFVFSEHCLLNRGRGGIRQLELKLKTAQGVIWEESVDCGGRRIWLHVARLCFFNGKKFVSNAHGISTEALRNNDQTWIFRDQSCVLCWPEELTNDLFLYIELNISFELTELDARFQLESLHRQQKLVDELTVCWTLIPCKELIINRQSMSDVKSFPLMYGNVFDIESYKRVTRRVTRRFLRIIGDDETECLLLLKVITDHKDSMSKLLVSGPLCGIGLPEVFQMAALYHECYQQALVKRQQQQQILHNYILRIFPKLLDDEDLYVHSIRSWRKVVIHKEDTSKEEWIRIFQDWIVKAAEVLNFHDIPYSGMNNDLNLRRKRRLCLEEFAWKKHYNNNNNNQANKYKQRQQQQQQQTDLHRYKPFYISEIIFNLVRE